MKVRFFLALWAGKFYMWLEKLRGHTHSDVAGIIMYKICPQFLRYVGKARYTITVTGTNGKTSVTSLINSCFKKMGYTTSYNEWGANLRAGHCVCTARGVDLFNRPKVDVMILEADEISGWITSGQFQPKIFVVNNICRDSMRRNGHPLNIRDLIQKTIDLLPDSLILLNGDDPIVCELKVPKDRVRYFSLDREPNGDPEKSRLREFTVCPRCYHKIRYIHHHFLHYGQYQCPNCGYASPQSSYTGVDFDPLSRTISMQEQDGTKVPVRLYSNSEFNAFNWIVVYAALRMAGFGAERCANALSCVQLPPSREHHVKAGGTDVIVQMCKGQTGSSASVVFDYLSREEVPMAVVMMLDEEFHAAGSHETFSWFYDCDFEKLNRDHIRQVLVAGPLQQDYRVRFRIAGIPEDRITCLEDFHDLADAVRLDGLERVYVLHEVDWDNEAFACQNRIAERIRKRIGEGQTA